MDIKPEAIKRGDIVTIRGIARFDGIDEDHDIGIEPYGMGEDSMDWSFVRSSLVVSVERPKQPLPEPPFAGFILDTTHEKKLYFSTAGTLALNSTDIEAMIDWLIRIKIDWPSIEGLS